ncbi:MAG: Ig-like domain-containing protein, partial [Hominilimicola sp.]
FSLLISTEFTEDTYIADIGMVPLTYEVTYNGKTIYLQSTALDDGYYEGDVTEFCMNFSPGSDEIIISNLSSTHGNMGEIMEGIYDISITAPMETGSVTRTVRLTVTDDDGTPPVPPIPVAEAVTYGTALSEIELGGSWRWAEPDTIPTVLNSGYIAYCSVDDVNCDYSGTEGYNEETNRIERTISLAVNKAETEIILGAENLKISGENRCVDLTVRTMGVENGDTPLGSITFMNGETEIGTADIENGSAKITWNNVPAGVHTIKAVYSGDDNYLMADGEMEYNLAALTVTGEKTGNINVTFTNLNDKPVNNAVMLAAAYDVEGVLQSVEKAQQSVNAEPGSEHEFKFDMTMVEYNNVKVFVWDGFETLIPII